MPDGTVPCYCPSSLTVAEFHPSMLFCLDDVALPQGLVIAIGPAYLPKGDFYDPRVDKSEYMQAGFWTKPETVKKYPRIRFVNSHFCVFKDENIRFVSNWLKLGARDIKLYNFRLMPHGFLNFGVPVVGKQSFIKAQ